METSKSGPRQYNHVLMRLLKSRTWESGQLEESLEEIAEAASRTLNVRRVNIWLFNEERSAIRCCEHYELDRGHEPSGVELAAADYPHYFRALDEERTIVADDAHADPRTREFSAGYLTPHGITSMMDAPLWSGGQVVGIICHEHVGPARRWTAEEQHFACSLADLASLVLETWERRQAEIALTDSKARTRLILETALDAVIIMDANGCISGWNRQAEAVFGWSPDEAIGKRLSELIVPENHRVAHERGLERFLATGRGKILDRRIEITALHRGGREFPVELSVTALRAGGSFAFSAFVRDITRRRRAEEEIRQLNAELEARVKRRTSQLEFANRELEGFAHKLSQSQEEMRVAKEIAEQASHAKSEFLAKMSHEIRTPMNGILGMVEMLLQTSLTREQRGYLELLDVSAETLLRLIDDILDFSKIEAGKLELERLTFRPRETVAHTLQGLRVQKAKKEVEIACRFAPDVPDTLLGDPGRLSQILVNLVGNAIKFTRRGDITVEIETESLTSEEACLHFVITDPGIGIPQDQLEAIFAAFSQADSSMSRRFGGTGLGLAISSQLVALMGGRIWAESQVGKGSTFHFTARFGRVGVEPRPLSPGLAEIEGLPVLVADHSDVSRGFLEGLLSNWRLKPVGVADGDAALRALRKAVDAATPYRLVITDTWLPARDGFSLAEEIRKDPALGRPKLLFLSTAGPVPDVSRCVALGADRCLAKPTDDSELLDAVLESQGMPTAPRKPKQLELERQEIEIGESPRRPLRVLVAEDNTVNQYLVVSFLKKRGHEVVVVENGRKALAALDDSDFDVAVMDVQMPEVDGFEATAAIRRAEESTGRHLPVVALTAHAMKGDRERCLAAGMDAYVSKPVRMRELIAAVERAALVSESGAADVPPAPPGGTGEAHVDLGALARRLGGDRSLMRELVRLYLKEAPKQLSLVRDAVQRLDATAIEKAAHALKSATANVAAEQASRLAQILEVMGRDTALEGIRERYAELEAELKRVLSALTTLLDVDADTG